MRKVRLIKEQELDDALIPLNIPVGYVEEGLFVSMPCVGEVFWVGCSYRTSIVQELIDTNTFRTYNSIYKWEIID